MPQNEDEMPGAVEVNKAGVVVKPAPKKKGRPPGALNKKTIAAREAAAVQPVPVGEVPSVTSTAPPVLPSAAPHTAPARPRPLSGPVQAPSVPKPPTATQAASVTPALRPLAVRRRG